MWSAQVHHQPDRNHIHFISRRSVQSISSLMLNIRETMIFGDLPRLMTPELIPLSCSCFEKGYWTEQTTDPFQLNYSTSWWSKSLLLQRPNLHLLQQPQIHIFQLTNHLFLLAWWKSKWSRDSLLHSHSWTSGNTVYTLVNPTCKL